VACTYYFGVDVQSCRKHLGQGWQALVEADCDHGAKEARDNLWKRHGNDRFKNVNGVGENEKTHGTGMRVLTESSTSKSIS
jgi:hypothetical protein